MGLPEGKTFALAITVDLDAQSAWLAKGMKDVGILQRGAYGADVGAPRLLEAFDRHSVATTWGIPGHSLETWPDLCREVQSRGHEICAHGVYHEHLDDMPEPTERRLMRHQLEQHQRILGTRPRGYRAPAFTLSSNTFRILEDEGFAWHSSICGRDFEPYRPREIVDIDLYRGTVYGREYKILEFPTSAYLEDWVAFEYVGGWSMGLSATDVVLQRWRDSLEWGRAHVRPGVMTLVLHPQSIGRPHHMVMLEEFLDYCTSLDDTWIATLSDIYDAWTCSTADSAQGAPSTP